VKYPREAQLVKYKYDDDGNLAKGELFEITDFSKLFFCGTNAGQIFSFERVETSYSWLCKDIPA
jgi:hypothetical protein